MEEPKRIPLDPQTPRTAEVEKRPLLSIEQELHAFIEDSKEYLHKIKKDSS